MSAMPKAAEEMRPTKGRGAPVSGWQGMAKKDCTGLGKGPKTSASYSSGGRAFQAQSEKASLSSLGNPASGQAAPR